MFQELIIIREVNKSYEAYEELDNNGIHSTTTGEDIFRKVDSTTNKNNLQRTNLKSFPSDGGRNMCSNNKRVVTKAIESDGSLTLYNSSTVLVRKMLKYV